MMSPYSEVSTMDDLQFRRSIYADPKSTDEAVQKAISDDPAKQQFAKELEALDYKVLDAMKVPVPDDLYDKLILRQTMASHQQQKKKSRIQLAMAASVAFALGLGLNFMQFSSAYTNVGDYALAHVYHEEGVFSNQDEKRVSLASLNQKMIAFDGSFNQSLGELISADYCRFDGMKSLHLVYKGVTDTVAVFVVPKNEQLDFSENFEDKKLQGESIGFKDANIIVVADKNESISKWQKSISDNITWSI